MLSHKDNEDLVRTGPGTLMGEYFRAHWIPFLPSSDLEAGGQPVRVRLLCEDLVAFRGHDGKVGLMDAACPHRRAPMAFARNEDCALRCVYHGWKINRHGEVLDMPAEPNKKAMKMVKMKAYPCQERNGIVWTYMGPHKDAPPPLPNMEWNLVPDEQVVTTFRVQDGNFMQGLEGDIDSAHAPILHGRTDGQGFMSSVTAAQDLCPKFEVIKQDYGLSIAAKRELENGKQYVRVNQLILPFYTFVPPQSMYPELTGHAWIPMDDEHCLTIMFSYHPSEPLHPRTRDIYINGSKAGRDSGHTSIHSFEPRPGAPYAKYWTKYRAENNYMFDYELQKSGGWFSGLPNLWVQDVALQNMTSAIADRSKEHLFSSDTGIVHARRAMLTAARAYAKNQETPLTATDPDVAMMRPVSLTLEPGEDWKEAGDTTMKARLGADFGYVP